MSCQSNRPGLISRVQLIISDMSWAICSVYMSLTCKMGIISSNISWRLFWGENHVKILAERRYSMDINSLPDYSGTEGDKEKFNPCKPAWDSKWKNMRTHWVTRYLVTMWRDCRKRGRRGKNSAYTWPSSQLGADQSALQSDSHSHSSCI